MAAEGGLQLFAAYPPVIQFEPPYNMKPQKCVVKVMSLSDKNIAYKVQINDPVRQFYTGSPSTGIVKPGETTRVTFELKPKVAVKELEKTTAEVHKIYLTAIEWPAKNSAYESDMFNELVKLKKNERQRHCFDVELGIKLKPS